MAREVTLEILIRQPEPDDADMLGEIHVRAWQAAYRGGLMPDDYLDELSVEDRAEIWRAALGREPRSRSFRLVAEADRRVAGFALGGPEAGEEDSIRGELYAINIDPRIWGQGVGRALLEAAESRLAASKFRVAVLWVHPDNERARRFYESTGWEVEGATRTEDVLGVTVPEIRYLRRLDGDQAPRD